MERTILYVVSAFLVLCLWLVARNDWVRMRRLSRTADAEVTGHRSEYHDNVRSYAAIYAFEAEGARHEVVDQLYSARPSPPLGARVQLTYPFGRPDLARVSRPLTWLFVYAILLLMIGIVTAKLIGWL